MKLHLPKVLLSAVLTACCAFSAQAAEIPDTYEQIDVWDAGYLTDYTTNTETDYYAFLLGLDVDVTPDIQIDGGNLIFTTYEGISPVSLEFTGDNAPALRNQSSLSFDTLSHLSFDDFSVGAITTSGNLIIQNVNDGVDDSENPDVSFADKSSFSYEGAIYANRVTIGGNGDVFFAGYSSSSSPHSGGAIYSCSDVNIISNRDVTFVDNSSSYSYSASGGAIYADSVCISGNSAVNFEGNSSGFGGAIFVSSVTIDGNGDVIFTGNTTFSSGGAIYADRASVCGNGDVIFAENSSSCGGAIDANSVSIIGNGDVMFVDNFSSTSFGGAIYANSVNISGNGDVSFVRNSASADVGGAIYAHSVTISGNGKVSFMGNTSSIEPGIGGGAIYAGSVNISGNDSVCIEKNYERVNSTYRLRSFDINAMNFSAKTGGHITFYDSVYGGAATLNADYTDAEGKTQKAKGDIIFSGLYTKAHLDAILEENNEGREATEAEILNSRTSILGETSLYGGRLRVEDGAIYQGQGITVHDGSEATVLVKNATLSHEGYALTFNAGTTLQVEGESLIVGDVLMMAQSVLNLEGETTINGALTLGLGMQLAGNILAEVQNLQVGESLTLVSGLESLAVQTQNLMRSVEYTTVMDGYEVQASEYFSNLAGNTGLVMRYDSEAGTVSICNTPAVPEPATATLSLLAFAALAARRRRK